MLHAHPLSSQLALVKPDLEDPPSSCPAVLTTGGSGGSRLWAMCREREREREREDGGGAGSRFDGVLWQTIRKGMRNIKLITEFGDQY